MHRLRVKYEKSGVGIFFSHLEVIRAVERSLRRADFPLVFSSGYTPRPRISYAPPLPVGYEGLSEYFDVLLRKRLARIEAGKLLEESFPSGFKLLDLKYVPLNSPSLMQISSYALYRVNIKEKNFDERAFQEAFLKYVSSSKLSYRSRGKEVEIKREEDYPFTRFDMDNLSINLLLSTGARRTIRPEVFVKPVFDSLKIPLRVRISRLALYCKRAKGLRELFDTSFHHC
jgi:radical SAM-linked protein